MAIPLEKAGNRFHFHIKSLFKSIQAVLEWCTVLIAHVRSIAKMATVGYECLGQLSMSRVATTDAGLLILRLVDFVKELRHRTALEKAG